jgi:acyl carrier protein
MNRDANASTPSGGPITVQGVASILEEAVQARPGQVQAGTLLEGLGGWDSMGMVNFVWLIEQRTGVKLRVGDLRKCPTPASLTQLIHDQLPG